MPSKTNVSQTLRAATYRRPLGRRALDALRALAASWRGVAPFQRQILNGLQDGRPLYLGTANKRKVAKRRARNKVARRSRRVNRSRR